MAYSVKALTVSVRVNPVELANIMRVWDFEQRELGSAAGLRGLAGQIITECAEECVERMLQYEEGEPGSIGKPATSMSDGIFFLQSRFDLPLTKQMEAAMAKERDDE